MCGNIPSLLHHNKRLFFYQHLTSEFLVWKLLTPVNSPLRKDKVYQHLLCVPCRVPLPTVTTDTVLTTSSFRLLRSILSLRTFWLDAILLADSLSLIYTVTQNWPTNQSTAPHDRMSRIVDYCCLSLHRD